MRVSAETTIMLLTATLLAIALLAGWTATQIDVTNEPVTVEQQP